MIGVFRNIIWHTSPYFKCTSSYLSLMLITATSIFNIIIHAHVSFYYQKVSNSVPLYIFGYHKMRKGPEPNNTVFDPGPFYWRRRRDIEPPHSARGKPPGGFSPIGLSCGLRRFQAAHIFYWRRVWDIKRTFGIIYISHLRLTNGPRLLYILLHFTAIADK